jgi:hypothetical protein
MRLPPVVSNDHALPDKSPPLRASESRDDVQGFECDVCGRHFNGEPASSGLFMWSRGDEIRYEEPPLCEECASKVTLGALLSFEIEGEEEG